MKVKRTIRLVLFALATLSACAEAKAPGDYPVINGGSVGGGGGGVGGGGGGSTGPGPGPGPGPMAQGRPSLSRIGDKIVEVGQELMFTLMATDPQGDTVSFNLRTDLPEGATFNKNLAIFSWTPVPAQAGMRFLLTFEASDGTLKDQETISVEVLAAGQAMNLPPMVDIISDQALVVGQPWRYEVQASDPNGDPLSYSITGRPLPDGLMFDSMTGVASWTPMMEGSYELIVTVTDGTLTVDQSMRLVVTSDENPSSAPPQFIEQPPVEVTLGQEVTFQLQAQYSGDQTLTYSLEQSPDPSASFDPNTQVFRWTPNMVQAYSAVFMVTDGQYRDHMQVEILVNEPPPPQVDCPADPDPVGQAVPINSGSNLSNRALCMVNELDSYTFTVSEPSVAELSITFDASNDLDLALYKDQNTLITSSDAAFGTMESISPTLDPGTYTAVVNLYRGQAATYSIQLTLTPADITDPPPVNCDADRLEPNNRAADAAYIDPNLYAELSDCGDEDWFSTSVTSGYPLVVYISSNDPNASLIAQEPSGVPAGTTPTYLSPYVDGCYVSTSPRAYCIRVEIYSTGVSRYFYKPTFSRPGYEYDLRVRLGDEVSSPCSLSNSYDCNPGYYCLGELNGESLGAATCTRSCTMTSDCLGSNRRCVIDSSTFDDSGVCFQECDTEADCREEFSCVTDTSVAGSSVKVCR